MDRRISRRRDDVLLLPIGDFGTREMKIDFQIAALAGCFFAGAFVSGLYYRAELADVKAEYASAAEAYQNELRAKERKNAERLAAATDAKQAEIDRLNGDLVSMRGNIERLRLAVSRRGGVPADDPGTGKSCQRQVRECVRLLSEGAGLLEEGSGLVGGLNADRAAVRKLMR